jgi:NDP-sugar pyrophosphorylase family protein
MAQPQPARLEDAVRPSAGSILNPGALDLYGGIRADAPVLIVLAAGKGTRFGAVPKCIQPVYGTPLARYSIDAFHRFAPAPVVCVVGYRHAEVSSALGAGNIYVRSANPAGGTALAAFEAFGVTALAERDPLLIVTMGDRIVPSAVFRRLWATHTDGGREASLTFLTAAYEPPKHHGKGRVLRDDSGRVVRIIEERDIAAEENEFTRQALRNIAEGNCPLYLIRARTLHRYLRSLTNANAQRQYYLTDVVEALSRDGREVRTVTTTCADPEYDLLCSDVTRPRDLALLEGSLAAARGLLFPEEREVEAAARVIAAGRPAGQIASIARQLEELLLAASREKLAFQPGLPAAIGISGGRLRIAFMHPDMHRFFGPAWQMPIGAVDQAGGEQIVALAQVAGDRCIHLHAANPKYRESVNSIPSDQDAMYPSEEISDLHAYERFGTRMSETLLLSLGYFSDAELAARRAGGLPLPPPSLWAANNMRRPFALVGNAIGSLRTLREGHLGAKAQRSLGREEFRGLRLALTGNIPQGGFASSSAVTVAVKNAVNALFELGIPPDLLVHLACQAEYGTGVHAGSLDQATEQKGLAGQGALISSNPRDNYRILGTYPVPAERFQIVFPYSVDRDREAWRWSWGAYGEMSGVGPLTTVEMRKMTGKAAEIAALLTRLPLDADFFKQVEPDLLSSGLLGAESGAWICSVLLQLPLRIGREELRQRLLGNSAWLEDQLMAAGGGRREAAGKVGAAIDALFEGWRDPLLRRGAPSGETLLEEGAPLRAMVAYLFGEVAKNFYLIHHPEEWTGAVACSQLGDRSVEIDPDRLPAREAMESEMDWERGSAGAERMDRWLARFGAAPFDFNRGLDDDSLSPEHPPEFHRLPGSNFFRGLALIDLAEAMLHRAFGREAVAVRVNAAGQGDYFQVHVDTRAADPSAVKAFLRSAFYRRFGLAPDPEFVTTHPGGGAAGVRLSRYEAIGQLISRLGAILREPSTTGS